MLRKRLYCIKIIPIILLFYHFPMKSLQQNETPFPLEHSQRNLGTDQDPFNQFIEHSIKYCIKHAVEKELRKPNLYEELVREGFTNAFYKQREKDDGTIDPKKYIGYNFERLDYNLKEYFSVRVPGTFLEGRMLLSKARLICYTSKGPVYCEAYIPCAYSDRHDYNGMQRIAPDFVKEHMKDFIKVGLIEINGETLLNVDPNAYLKQLQAAFEAEKKQKQRAQKQQNQIEKKKKVAKTIELTPEQQHALSQSLPLFLMGEAGTGKSATLARMFKDAARKAEMTDGIFTTIYVSPSQELCSKMRDLYEQMDKPDNFKFMSFGVDSLIETFDPESMKAERVGFRYFRDWIKKHPSYKSIDEQMTADLYNELQLIAVCVDDTIYQDACGERNKTIAGVRKKDCLDLYYEYIQALTDTTLSPTKKIDLFLHRFQFKIDENLAKSVQYIMVDEAQNLPLGLINALLNHKNLYNKLACYMDQNQTFSLNDHHVASMKNTFDLLRTNLYALIKKFGGKQDISIAELTQQFRNAQPISDLAMYFLRLTYQMYGKESKFQALPKRQVTGLEGSVQYVEDLKLLEKIPNLVMIVPNQLAKEQLPLPATCTKATVQEMQGQQARNVAMVGFFDNIPGWNVAAIQQDLLALLKKNKQGLKNFIDLLLEETTFNRPDTKFNQTRNLGLIRMMYIVLTRGEINLYILAPQESFRLHFKNEIKDKASQELEGAPAFAYLLELLSKASTNNGQLDNEKEINAQLDRLLHRNTSRSKAKSKTTKPLVKEEVKEEEKENTVLIPTQKSEHIEIEIQKEEVLETITMFLDSSLTTAHQHASNPLHRTILNQENKETFSFNHFAIHHYLKNINNFLRELSAQNAHLSNNNLSSRLPVSQDIPLQDVPLIEIPYFVNTLCALAEIAREKASAFKQLVVFFKQLKTLETLQELDPAKISIQALESIHINQVSFFEYLRELANLAPTQSDKQDLFDCLKDHLNLAMIASETAENQIDVTGKKTKRKLKKTQLTEEQKERTSSQLQTYAEKFSVQQAAMMKAPLIEVSVKKRQPSHPFIDALLDERTDRGAPNLFSHLLFSNLATVKNTLSQIRDYHRLSDVFNLRAANGVNVLNSLLTKYDKLKFTLEMLSNENPQKLSELLDNPNADGHSLLFIAMQKRYYGALALLISYCTDLTMIRSLLEERTGFADIKLEGIACLSAAKALVLRGEIEPIEEILALYHRNDLNISEVKELKELFHLAVEKSKYGLIETFLQYIASPDQKIKMQNLRVQWNTLIEAISRGNDSKVAQILDQKDFNPRELVFRADEQGNTALHYAITCPSSNLKVISLLLPFYTGYPEKLETLKNKEGKNVLDYIEEGETLAFRTIEPYLSDITMTALASRILIKHNKQEDSYEPLLWVRIEKIDNPRDLNVALKTVNFENYSAWTYAFVFDDPVAIRVMNNAYNAFASYGVEPPSLDYLIHDPINAEIKPQLEKVKQNQAEIKKYAPVINYNVSSLRSKEKSASTLSSFAAKPELLLRILAYAIFTKDEDLENIVKILMEPKICFQTDMRTLTNVLSQYVPKRNKIDMIAQAVKFDTEDNRSIETDTEKMVELMSGILSMEIDVSLFEKLFVTKEPALKDTDGVFSEKDCIQTAFIEAIKLNDMRKSIQIMNQYVHNPLYLLNIKEGAKTVLQLAVMHRNKKIFNHLFTFFEKAYALSQAILNGQSVNSAQQEAINCHFNHYKEILNNKDSNNFTLLQTAVFLNDPALVGCLLKMGVSTACLKESEQDVAQWVDHSSSDRHTRERFLEELRQAEPEQHAKLISAQNDQSYSSRLFEIAAKKTMLNDLNKPLLTASALEFLKTLIESAVKIGLDLNNIEINPNKKSKGVKKSAIEYLQGIKDQGLQETLERFLQANAPCSVLQALQNNDDVTLIPKLLSNAEDKFAILMHKDQQGKTPLANAVYQLKTKFIRQILKQFDSEDCLDLLLRQDHESGKNLLQIWIETAHAEPDAQEHMLKTLLSNLTSSHLQQLMLEFFINADKGALKEIITSGKEAPFKAFLTVCEKRRILSELITHPSSGLTPWNNLLKQPKMLKLFLETLNRTYALASFFEKTNASGHTFLNLALLDKNLAVFNMLLKCRNTCSSNSVNPLKNHSQMLCLLQMALQQDTDEFFNPIVDRLTRDELEAIGPSLVFELIEKHKKEPLIRFCQRANRLAVVPNFPSPSKGSTIFYTACLGNAALFDQLFFYGADLQLIEKKTKEELNEIIENSAQDNTLEASRKRLEQWLFDNQPNEEQQWEIQPLDITTILGHTAFAIKLKSYLADYNHFISTFEDGNTKKIEKDLMQGFSSDFYLFFTIAVKRKDASVIRSFLKTCKQLNCKALALANAEAKGLKFVHPQDLVDQAIEENFYNPLLLAILLEVYEEDRTYILKKKVKLQNKHYPLLMATIALQDLESMQLILNASQHSTAFFSEVLSATCTEDGRNALHMVLTSERTAKIEKITEVLLHSCQYMGQFLLDARALDAPTCSMLFYALGTKQLNIINMFIEAAVKEELLAESWNYGPTSLLDEGTINADIQIIKILIDALKKSVSAKNVHKALQMPHAIFSSEAIFEHCLEEGLNPSQKRAYRPQNILDLFKSKNPMKIKSLEKWMASYGDTKVMLSAFELAFFAKKGRVRSLQKWQDFQPDKDTYGTLNPKEELFGEFIKVQRTKNQGNQRLSLNKLYRAFEDKKFIEPQKNIKEDKPIQKNNRPALKKGFFNPSDHKVNMKIITEAKENEDFEAAKREWDFLMKKNENCSIF